MHMKYTHIYICMYIYMSTTNNEDHRCGKKFCFHIQLLIVFFFYIGLKCHFNYFMYIYIHKVYT